MYGPDLLVRKIIVLLDKLYYQPLKLNLSFEYRLIATPINLGLLPVTTPSQSPVCNYNHRHYFKAPTLKVTLFGIN